MVRPTRDFLAHQWRPVEERRTAMKPMKMVALALSCTVAFVAKAQSPKSTRRAFDKPEFLQIQFGKSLAEQFPECKTYVTGTPEYDRQISQPRAEGFRCYHNDYVFDHEFSMYEGKDMASELETALARTKSDGDTGEVGYVGTSYTMDIFKETFLAIKAKRGQPTSCSTAEVHNLMGARMKQIHCQWKQAWGVIAVTAPSDDDLTQFDVWAQTNHHMQLRKQEQLTNQKRNSKDF
jgi:hypothetical protein